MSATDRQRSTPQDLQSALRRRGLTILELLVSLLMVAVALVIAVPTLAGAKGNSGVQKSMSNMASLGVAHVLYALDWDLRQVTWVKDDLGAYGGDTSEYNFAAGGCSGYPVPEECQPPMVAGWNCEGSGPWAYWPNLANAVFLQPMNFPGSPEGCASCAAWGTFRVPNAQPLHGYLNGRYHDPVYYAPNDFAALGSVQACMESPCEFDSSIVECNPGWSSYAMSPAAMFHHDVMRSNAAGGWQAPWMLDHGYQAPGFFQATYPDLKTLMIEHSWVQDPPGKCNPAFLGCEPYYFNAGIDSVPATLFYDVSVRLLPNTEVYASDQQVLKQTGGVDGLWHRGTSFGSDGYLIASGFDGTPLSHHILTTDGILGRDTLGGAVSPARPPKRAVTPAIGSPSGETVVSIPPQHSLRFSVPKEAGP